MEDGKFLICKFFAKKFAKFAKFANLPILILPIFKKGKKCDAGNYRPVSLTSHVCKILESIIKDSIINHINVNNLLYESQHGFISKRSCLTNLLQFIETVTDYVDQGYPVDIIF